ncbi:hypothetical protein PMG11_10895 [Penicillium brasilianum]|uniref:Integral membrane bound transporter domain-containing protein n=1 Tax=Penicillium brasilianum TaxID=104259 RepID=A0A0F7U3T9_PENBI|nr:hypothetical protein PMG11_10895 [Penicillium brasilianum]
MRPDTRDQQEELEPFLISQETAEDERLTTRVFGQISRTWRKAQVLIASEQAVGIFKCSLAYLLASLAVFIPVIGSLLGNQYGKHLVATITIYFHPARSQGSMYKALICAFVAFLFATFLSLSSMWVTITIERKHDLIELGHAVVLIVFVMGGFGFIGWIKQRLQDPLANVACSLASLASILVITKEGAVQTGDLSFTKISQILRMLLLGIGVSTAVSLSILPVSARKKFRGDLSTLTGTVTAMLMSTTESFLRGTDRELQTADFTKLYGHHDKVFGQLKTLLGETKLEHYVAGTKREHSIEKRLVSLMQDITHGIGGLRSAVTLQSKLLAPTKYTRTSQSLARPAELPNPAIPASSSLAGESQAVSWEDAQPFGNGDSILVPGVGQQSSSIHSPAEIFEKLTSGLEVSILSLAHTLRETFAEISFGPAPDYRLSISDGVTDRINEAVDLYREARHVAFSSLRRDWEMISPSQVDKASLEEIFANCEYFSVSLLELSERLRELLLSLEELQAEVNERPDGRSWEWLRPSWWPARREQALNLNEASSLRNTSAAGNTRSPLRIANTSDQSGGVHRGSTRNYRAGQDVVRLFDFLRKDEIKFALKVGIGAALYALPSFISVTRPYYLSWRGEWGLISYMLVCSMIIGASNTTGFARFLGTCLGGLCSIAAWYLAGDDAVKLALTGFVMAIGPFYVILVKGQGPMGRFILLTYNLSVLYAFSHSQIDMNDANDEIEHLDITSIVLRRVISVITGNIWGIIITRGIWPIRARTKLDETLQTLWLRLALVWESDPLNTISRGDATTPVLYLDPRDKAEIEHLLSQLDPMQASARSEFELRDPFPDAAYSNVIRWTRDVVDNFHSMDLVLSNLAAPSEGQMSLLRHTAVARQRMSECIGNSLITSAVDLGHSFDTPTNVERSRDELLAQISRYRQDKRASHATNDEDYVLLYAYIIVSRQLSNEIVQITTELGRIFPASDEDLVGAVRV